MNLDNLVGLALAAAFALYLFDLVVRAEILDGAAYGQDYSAGELVPIRGPASDQPRPGATDYSWLA